MAAYQTFTAATIIPPDPAALLGAVRTACGDGAAGLNAMTWPRVTIKKATAWTAPQITATQAAIDSCPALTPQRQAQNEIDRWPLSMQAFCLALIDQINVLRAGLPAPLPAVTPAQALAAIKQKASTL